MLHSLKTIAKALQLLDMERAKPRIPAILDAVFSRGNLSPLGQKS